MIDKLAKLIDALPEKERAEAWRIFNFSRRAYFVAGMRYKVKSRRLGNYGDLEENSFLDILDEPVERYMEKIKQFSEEGSES